MKCNEKSDHPGSLADPGAFSPMFQSDRVGRSKARLTLAGGGAHAGLAEGIATLKGSAPPQAVIARILCGVDARGD